MAQSDNLIWQTTLCQELTLMELLPTLAEQ
ncbi:Hypothetical protein Y17_0120 [Pectobacterium wasabiae CFBP 3304]|nr:Hypothetical protein Y17_0120 [Pectobacterium wasabiae CFBP 3304]